MTEESWCLRTIKETENDYSHTKNISFFTTGNNKNLILLYRKHKLQNNKEDYYE